MNGRRIGLALACLALASCASAPADESRATRVAVAERTVWDRYGEQSTMAGMEHPVASEAQAIADMIAHHLDAIDGSQRIVETTRSTQVREFAQRVIRVQTEQVDQMRQWLAAWFDVVPTSDWSPMFADPATTATDQVYLEVMIAHHEHAIAMYSGWVTAGVVHHDQLGLLAARIAQGQEGEIAFMRQLVGAAAAAT